MVLSGKAVCLCIHLTFMDTVGSILEQRKYIHTTATLMAAGVARSLWALFLLKTPLTITEEFHSHQSTVQLQERGDEWLKGHPEISAQGSHYYPSLNSNREKRGYEITKRKRNFAHVVYDFLFVCFVFRLSIQVFGLNKMLPFPGKQQCYVFRLINKKLKSNWFLVSTVNICKVFGKPFY